MHRFTTQTIESRAHGPAPFQAGDGLEGTYHGTLHSVPAGGECQVILPGLDELHWLPARCSTSASGSVGQEVVVSFDDDKTPWVVLFV